MKSNLGAGVSNLGAGISSNSSVGGALMFSGKKGTIAAHSSFITNGVGQVYEEIDYSASPDNMEVETSANSGSEETNEKKWFTDSWLDIGHIGDDGEGKYKISKFISTIPKLGLDIAFINASDGLKGKYTYGGWIISGLLKYIETGDPIKAAQEAFKGLTSSVTYKLAIKKLGEPFAKKTIARIVTGSIGRQFTKRGMDIPKALAVDATKTVSEQFTDLTTAGIPKGSLISGMLSNYGASCAFGMISAFAGDMIGDLITKGEVDFSDYGTTIYVGAWTTVGEFAGGLIFGKVGSKIGGFIGSLIGNATVGLYSSEEARAWAGGAVLVGAAVGMVLVLALVSNPAGWVVGLAMIAGAVIGAAIVFIIDHWDDICEAFEKEAQRLGDEFEYQRTHNAVDGFLHVGENFGNRAAEYATNIWSDGYQFGDVLSTAWHELVVNPTQLLGDGAMYIAGQITGYVERAAEKTEEVWDDGYQFGDCTATIGAWLGFW